MSEETNTNCLPTRDEYLRELKNTPLLSIPAFGLFLIGFGMIGWFSYLAMTGVLPYWAATLVNGVAMYFIFSPMHEGLHRNISSIPLVNNVIGRISLLALLPGAPMEVARWMHFQHHRGTSDPETDPDMFMHHGNFLQLMFRWANLDIYYIIHFLRFGGKELKARGASLAITMALFIGLVTAFSVVGYGIEVLFFWFLPSRIGLCLIGYVFVFLPHYPADTSAKESEYQATTVRRGWEWLLTPVLVYQNYHLIHHLFPTAPFYNYIKIWHLLYDDISAQNPAIQKPFSLLPINHEKTVTATVAG
jgi:beta-carotene hydroxylase